MTMTMTRRWRWRWWCCCGINLGNTGSIIVSCQCRHVISYRIHRVNGWACSKPPCSQQKPANTCSPKCNHPREEHLVPWTCCHTFLLVGRIWSSLPKLPTCVLRTLILMQHKVQTDQHDHSSLHHASPFTHVLHRRWWFPSWFASAKITPWWRWGAWTPRLRLGERVSFTVTIPNSWFVTLLRQNDKMRIKKISMTQFMDVYISFIFALLPKL